jgi:hypothetical protein
MVLHVGLLEPEPFIAEQLMMQGPRCVPASRGVLGRGSVAQGPSAVEQTKERCRAHFAEFKARQAATKAANEATEG